MKILFLFLILLFFSISGVQGQVKNSLHGTIYVKKFEKKFFATISGKQGGKISADELCKNPILVSEGNIEISEFSVSLNYNGILMTRVFKGNYITGDLCLILSDLKKGTKVYIEEIKAKEVDSNQILIEPLYFTIDTKNNGEK